MFRNGTIQRVNRSAGLGIVDDVACMCRIAEIGPIVKSRLRLFEYRIHGSQESQLIDQLLIDRRNQFLVELADGDKTRKKIQRNIHRVRTSILMAHSLKHMRNLEFEIGIKSLAGDIRDKNIRVRYLLNACLSISRSLLDAYAKLPN